MTTPKNWQATAYNQAFQSDNLIHSDEMANSYGFQGALVPGVTISAYLMHPAIEAWGIEWLEHGKADIVIHKPLYDGYAFKVQLSEVSNTAYQARLIDQAGSHCATAHCLLIDPQVLKKTANEHARRQDPLFNHDHDIQAASHQTLKYLQQNGMCALATAWDGSTPMATYLQDPTSMPDIFNASGHSLANGAYMLGLTNSVLAGNVYMNPWIHLQTTSQNYQMVTLGTQLVIECDIENLFEKKGHEFIDLNVQIYQQHSEQLVMTAQLRAIYKLRPPNS
ncbi:MAG: hypothetical protein KUG79_09295 [Pseudomonadales bacterium]|nr:hypothetical protein [Pseudomonadales bacterium]